MIVVKLKKIFLIYFNEKKSWLFLIGNVCLTLINFLFTSFLSHSLDANIYGDLKEILFYSGFLSVLTYSGLAQALYYFLFVEDSETNKRIFIKQSRILQIILSVVISLILLIGNMLGVLNAMNSLFVGIYLLGINFVSIDLNIAVVYNKLNVFFITNILILSVKIFVVYLFFQNSLSFVLAVNSVFFLLNILNNYVILNKLYLGDSNWTINKDVIYKLLIYCFPIIGSAIIGYLIGNIDKLIISLFSKNNIEFAILSNVSFEIPIISNIYMSFFTMALPAMITNFKSKNINKLLKERESYIKSVASLVFPFVILIIIWSKNIFPLVFGSFYQDYVYLFALYSLTGLLRFCNHNDVFIATGKTRYIIYISLFELVFHTIISVFLYLNYSISGLIIASLITNYMYVLLIAVLNSIILNVNLYNVLPFRALFKILLLASSSAYCFKKIGDYFLVENYWILSLCCWLIFYVLFNIREKIKSIY